MFDLVDEFILDFDADVPRTFRQTYYFMELDLNATLPIVCEQHSVATKGPLALPLETRQKRKKDGKKTNTSSHFVLCNVRPPAVQSRREFFDEDYIFMIIMAERN